MNWLDSREKKEKEKHDAKVADEKAREELRRQSEEFSKQSIPIIQDINILIAKLRWLLPAAYTSTSHLFSNTDAREIISSSLVDDKNISTKTDATNKQELNFDLVEYFYLLRSIFLFIKKGNIDGAVTIGICNVPGSSVGRETDCGIYTRCGHEVGVASTKAFTAQIAILYFLALKLASAKGEMSKASLRRHLDYGDSVKKIKTSYL